MSERPSLPAISVVVPSFNQVDYLEETLKSIFDQQYPNLEMIVLDGGSTDGSVAILEQYSEHFDYWRTGPDGGHSAALAEGFDRSSGDVLCWINSDDTLCAGTLDHVGEVFASDGFEVLVGGAVFTDSRGEVIGPYPVAERDFQGLLQFWRGWPIPQPATFFSRSAYSAVGGLRTDLEYVMDLDLFLRMAREFQFAYSKRTLATYRVHSESKTADWRATRYDFWVEALPISEAFWPPLWSPRRWYYYTLSRLNLALAYADKRRLGK